MFGSEKRKHIHARKEGERREEKEGGVQEQRLSAHRFVPDEPAKVEYKENIRQPLLMQ
jgi:hypothetical protein